MPSTYFVSTALEMTFIFENIDLYASSNYFKMSQVK